MRKLFCLMLLLSVPVLASDDEEARIKTAVEDRYKEWIAAANKKDAAALTNLYDENAVLMPKEEEPVIGKAAIDEYYKKLVADPHFVPFTLTLNWNSFHLVGDIAIATALFEGDVTRNGKQNPFPRQEPACLEETGRRLVEDFSLHVRRDSREEITGHSSDLKSSYLCRQG